MEEFNAAAFSSTRAYTAPQPQAQDREKLIRDTLEQLPVLKKVIKHLDEQIKFFDSIDSVAADVKDPQALVNEIAANKLAKAKLQAERAFILARVEEAAKR